MTVIDGLLTLTVYASLHISTYAALRSIRTRGRALTLNRHNTSSTPFCVHIMHRIEYPSTLYLIMDYGIRRHAVPQNTDSPRPRPYCPRRPPPPWRWARNQEGSSCSIYHTFPRQRQRGHIDRAICRQERKRRTTSSSPTSPSPRGQLRHCPWLLAPAAQMWKWLIRTHSASLRRLESGWRHVEEKRRHATAGGGRNLPFLGDPTRDAASGSARPPQNKTNSCPRQQATRLRTPSTLPFPASAGRQPSATGGNGR